MRPQEVQMREFEVLQKVKHENIVKLLAIEEEQEGRGKVIVMELCTGGSLFNLLDDPENSYGLDEDEWLLVLSHLSAGMNHLRDNNLVHRDLKPGNIMKFIKDDGSIVYKLTDFGAARELQDDQQFVSLYGTEEYLHPDMYERAVLRKPVGKTFGATVDLWSIGVTLYHVATGNLPFRPFGGRRNKETMFHITTKKSSGVISGVQTSDNGPIQWSRELPNSCLLSQGIKKHITPLLAGLLEVNATKRWTFERFFSEVTHILNKKKCHIYYMNKLTDHRVYLDSSENLDNFRSLLAEQLTPEIEMILLYGENELTHYVKPTTPGVEFPDTRRDNPIILFNKNHNGVALGIEKEVPSFPTMSNLVSVENDATLAKSACAVGYAYKRKIESYTRCLQTMNKSVSVLSEVINQHLNSLYELSSKSKLLTSILNQQINFYETLIQNKPPKTSTNDVIISQFKSLKAQLNELNPAIEQLHKRYVGENHLIREWKDVNISKDVLTSSIKAQTYVAKLKESWQHLLRDRASRTLTYNDEQFHILEKIKMQETIRTLMDLLTKEITPAVNNQTEHMADWYKMAQTTFLQTEILKKDISLYMDKIKDFSDVLKDAQEAFSPSLKANGTHNHHHQYHTPTESRQLKKAVKNILTAQDEVWGILRENTRLIEQFGALVSTSSSNESQLQSGELLAQIEQLSLSSPYNNLNTIN